MDLTTQPILSDRSRENAGPRVVHRQFAIPRHLGGASRSLGPSLDRSSVEPRLAKANNDVLLDLIDAYHLSRDGTSIGKWISLRVWRRVNSKIQKRDTIRRRLLRLGWGSDTFDPDRGDYVPKWVAETAEKTLDWRSI